MNMRNNYLSTHRLSAMVMIACCFVCFGCEDFLTRDVPNQTTEAEWWQTRGQLQTALNNIYKVMPSGTLVYDNQSIEYGQGYGYPNQRVEQEALTDNGIASANYVTYDVFDAGAVPGTDRSVMYIWRIKWKAIRLACRYLKYYTQAKMTPDPSPHEGIQTVDRWAAEARACRAFYHMELFFYYGEIPIVDHVLEGDEQLTERQPADSVVKWITNEFYEASLNLPRDHESLSEDWRWTKGACYAWMSYVYLYAGDWANAKKWAEEVINLGKYSLYRDPDAPENSYANQFLHKAQSSNSPEPIFIKQLGMRQVHTRLAPPISGNSQTGLSPTASLVDAYEILKNENGEWKAYTMDELTAEERAQLEVDPKCMKRDPRLEASILFPGETFLGITPQPFDVNGVKANCPLGVAGSTRTGYWVKKWANSTDWALTSANAGTLDFYIMRYAVILLNYAEAAIELNQIDDPKIYEYLDDIRDRAGMPPVDRTKYNTQEKLRELVRRERRVELAFEGHRLFDIRRWKIGFDVMRGTIYGATNPNTGERITVINRVFNERDYLWPIPTEEMTSNPNMVQNEGY